MDPIFSSYKMKSREYCFTINKEFSNGFKRCEHCQHQHFRGSHGQGEFDKVLEQEEGTNGRLEREDGLAHPLFW